MRDNSSTALEGGSGSGLEGAGDIDYLGLSRRAYESSTDYIQANLRRSWERNLSNFMSRHPPGSKYRTESYKHRSRLFRPKTRASVQAKEAALAIAFFSTSDVVAINATNEADPAAVEAAKVMHEVVNLRLNKTIPWFPLVVGAFQEANVLGSIVSHQYWDYEEGEGASEAPESPAISTAMPEPAVTPQMPVPGQTPPMQGQMPMPGQTPPVQAQAPPPSNIIKDEPVIELVELENFRFDPAANWLDPINTSPYLIQLIPMYIVDVLDRMGRKDKKTGQPVWEKMDISEIMTAQNSKDESHDSTRQAREGHRQDPKSDSFSDVDEHQIVWIHRNIFKLASKGDYIWYTLGTHKMLTKPVPLKEVYLHGRRPYALGHTVIETFRNYPSGTGELGQDMQSGANDLMNQRFDNIRQVLNKRFFVRRGATVDLRSLRRNVPGSITMMSDIEKDVKEKETSDVTSSSYQEQNLFNSDFDEITGNFSAGSVQTNKQLGETVGGMKMLKDPSNTLTEFVIRVFAETWVKPVISQIVALEQAYETDEVLVTAAGRAAKMPLGADGKPVVPGALYNAGLDVAINVGFGVTDPQSRVAKILFGAESVAKIAPQALQRLKDEEIVKEIFGILGYQDGSRFFMNDEEFAQYQQANPPQPPPEILKIQSQEKIEMAKLEHDSDVWEARLESDELKKAAELNVQFGTAGGKYDLELGRRDIEIEKLNLERLGLDYKREDMLRKDAEIRDKEKPKRNRSGGASGDSA